MEALGLAALRKVISSMYTKHFGLMPSVFSRDITPEFLFNCNSFKEGLARLQYVCKNRTMAVVTGEIGAGKSTLLRLLQAKLDPNHYTFIYIADSRLTVTNFYTYILNAINVEPPRNWVKLKRTFQSVLMDLSENSDMTCIVVIDEAQFLTNAMISELTFALNFGVDSFSPMAVILSGQSEFKFTLKMRSFAPVFRRVETFYHLEGLSQEETRDYVFHQLKIHGCNHPLFGDDVIARIYQHSKGIPSAINRLCKNCLLDASSRGQQLIDVENLQRVLSEFSA